MYDEKEQLKLIEAIENGISLLKNHENTKFGFIYAESGLPIHIEKTAVDKLKLHMESMDSFKEEIERRNYLQDRIDNMDI